MPAPEWPVRKAISPGFEVEREFREGFAPVRVTLEDAVESDHGVSDCHGSQQPLDIGTGVEDTEILRLFANADEADRQAKAPRDRDHDAALGRAVELRDDDAGDADRLAELLGLAQRAFCPRLASSTSSTSCGASGSRRLITRAIFASSSIRCDCVCSRPAVSAISTSVPRAFADCSASKTTAAGSAPVACETIGTPLRSAQTASLLDGRRAKRIAGREQHGQSPGPSGGGASLPIVVVLPEPFTPTTRIT